MDIPLGSFVYASHPLTLSLSQLASYGHRALSVLDIKKTVEQLLIEEGLIKRYPGGTRAVYHIPECVIFLVIYRISIYAHL